MASSNESLSPMQQFDFALATPNTTTTTHTTTTTTTTQTPIAKRQSPSSSTRLGTIDETPMTPPPIPVRSTLRESPSQSSIAQAPPSFGLPPRSVPREVAPIPAPPPPPVPPAPAVPPPKVSGETTTSSRSARTAPPAYSWMPDIPSSSDDDLRAPVEGQKLAALRRSDQQKPPRQHRQRGGWTRLLLIIAAIIIMIGLAVGLGVGLTVGRQQNSDNGNSSQDQQPSSGSPSSGSGSGNSSTTQAFPVGQYSLVTALRAQQSSCSANSAIWTCYSYQMTNSSSSGTDSTDYATFNWVITTTSSNYATNETGSTSDKGIPANLSVSSTNNPFGISFSNQPLTYISSSSNSSSARYTFSVEMSKYTVPSVSLTNDNTQSRCFFNATTLSGSLYLSAARNFPAGSLMNSTSVGGFTQWPFAVEVTQSSPGGANIPACYSFVNGTIGDRIATDLAAQPASSECLCGYRNF